MAREVREGQTEGGLLTCRSAKGCRPLCSQAWGYEISVPTLVIGGGRDRFYPTCSGTALRQGCPRFSTGGSN